MIYHQPPGSLREVRVEMRKPPATRGMKSTHRVSAWTMFMGCAFAAAWFAATPTKWTAPLGPDGHSDLQGLWSNATITPFERPRELAGKQYFTEQEAAEYEKTFVWAAN